MYGYPQNPPVYGVPSAMQAQPQNQYPIMMQPQGTPYQTGYASQEPQAICRPVASYEEARSLPTDLSGAPMIMPDFGHEAIYFKQLNPQTGQAPIHIFKRDANARPAAPQDYAPVLADIEKRLKHLEDIWEVSPEKSGQEEKTS